MRQLRGNCASRDSPVSGGFKQANQLQPSGRGFTHLGISRLQDLKTIQKEIRMNIYVGNLSYQLTEDELRQAFEAFGQVESANIIRDKYTGQSRGFGFVEMPSAEEAQSAISGLNGKELQGRSLNVNEARPRSENRGGRGNRGGGRRY
jgi:RNA recognition motif-containing protein